MMMAITVSARLGRKRRRQGPGQVSGSISMGASSAEAAG